MSAKTTAPAIFTIWAIALCLFTGLIARADDPTPPAAPTQSALDEVNKLIATLKWQTGKITLKDGLATINLNDNYRFLNTDDSNKVLHDLWGNPVDSQVLGMIFPANVDLTDEHSWGVIVSYEESGYVKDDDADKINYDDLLKQIKQETLDENAQRKQDGSDPIELVGWAAPPRYDKATHKYYWAEDIRSQGPGGGESLNYFIRVLGRRGVLVLNALAHMEDFKAVDEKVPDILSMVDFQAGNTYADFDPKVDKIAEYGLIGLITAGGLAGAAKLGLLAGLWKFIITGAVAFYKIIIVAVVALGAAIKNLWSKITGGGGSSNRNNLPPPN